ncbi:GTP-binding protein 10 isoform X1 [Ixodes scapularis]|uniref:GTP-binding protein, putative n=1 Tax=Ixodes scapularis TaxID=6945 RepID=B7PGB6_IXOSC|nr:GTP-binding protein 10 isoform X1 [Ixodes scapularis]EEC05638.1 GTP-binding protein, putative [Ixodes scapularis]|eukprot:XP_002434238.1 GTP-binding protein, putative [Ixodes scapularis]
MVVLTHIRCCVVRISSTKRFLDKLRLNVRGGNGGTGLPRFGGVGGEGGSIYVQAKDKVELKDIITKYPDKTIKAGHGGNSKSTQILGPDGHNVVVNVPVGVSVFNGFGHLIGDLIKPGDKVLAVKGGKGGNPATDFHGTKGQTDVITLHLKLIADVGFVGFPNAGKSTLLRALSRAVPKVANYPFTTIRPNIGIMEYEDHRQISLADLPGLIEGAHRNFGLGHNFLRHVERTSMLLFIVDVNGFQLNERSKFRNAFETVMSLNKELELYKEALLEKPAILAVNKMDTDDAKEKYEELLESLGKENVSSLDEEIRPSKIIQFDDIIPIVARDAKNTPQIQQKIRSFMDMHVERQREATRIDFSSPSPKHIVI